MKKLFMLSATLLTLVIASAAQAETAVAVPEPQSGAEPVAAADTGSNYFPKGMSATVTFASDYVFRGISQSDESPAVQLGLDWAHDSGFYVGAWGSNVDFNDGDEAKYEVDYYAGYNHVIGPYTLGVGAIYYDYPGASDNLNYDFYEFKGSLAYDFGFANAVGSAFYTPDGFGAAQKANYYNLAVTAPLPHDFKLMGGLGRSEFASDLSRDYTDWSLGLGYEWQGFNFALSYIDTNLSKANCADGCEARALFTVSKTFN